MEADDIRVTIRFSNRLAKRAEGIAKQTLDEPADCTHTGAVYLCDLHRDVGPACSDCMRAHLRSHSKTDDQTCSTCGRVGPVTRGAVAAGEFAVLTFTCADGNCIATSATDEYGPLVVLRETMPADNEASLHAVRSVTHRQLDELFTSLRRLRDWVTSDSANRELDWAFWTVTESEVTQRVYPELAAVLPELASDEPESNPDPLRSARARVVRVWGNILIARQENTALQLLNDALAKGFAAGLAVGALARFVTRVPDAGQLSDEQRLLAHIEVVGEINDRRETHLGPARSDDFIGSWDYIMDYLRSLKEQE